MNKPKRTRRITAANLRQALIQLTEQLCAAQERFTLALKGNTVEIHLHSGTINITVNEATKGDEA